MALKDYQIIFNTSVQFKEPLPLTEKGVVELFGEVMQAIPDLNDYQRGDSDKVREGEEDEEGTFSLIQRGKGRHVRQLQVRSKNIVIAVAPPLGVAEADQTARTVYPLLSRHLEPNTLLLEFLDISFRFELPYRGNHNLLVLTKLFGNTPFAQIAQGIEGTVRNFEPDINLSISSDHSLIAVLTIRTGTTSREIESQVYDGDDLKVLCGIAKVRGLAGKTLEQTYAAVYAEALPFLEQRVVNALVKPLQEAISSC